MISVVLSACNGARYIRDQLESLLFQLEPEDEVIVSLDPSQDETENIVRAIGDSRIRLLKGPGRGVSANVENGLKAARGELIFLADQDDIWKPDKVQACRQAMKDHDLLMHDCAYADEKLAVFVPSRFAKQTIKTGRLANVIKNRWMGCCLVLNQELKARVLPFPENIPMYDQWLGLQAQKPGLLDQVLLVYRRHEDNATSLKPAGITQQLKWRFQLVKALYQKRRKRI